MIKNFYPQAYPLWVVQFDNPASVVEPVIGWALSEVGTLSPVAGGFHGGVVVCAGRWAIYDDRDQADRDRGRA